MSLILELNAATFGTLSKLVDILNREFEGSFGAVGQLQDPEAVRAEDGVGLVDNQHGLVK